MLDVQALRHRGLCLMSFPSVFSQSGRIFLIVVASAACFFPQSGSQGPNGPVLIHRGPRPHSHPPSPLLTFHIVVFDAKGAPVRDLRDSDLRIWDDGKRMPAASCRLFQTAEPPAARLGPREYSNRPTRGVLETTVVSFDLLNEDLAERGYGWNELGRAFRKLESGQNFYVYLLTREGTAYPIRGLPSGPMQLEDNAD